MSLWTTCVLQAPSASTGPVVLQVQLRPSVASYLWQQFLCAGLTEENSAKLSSVWFAAAVKFVRAVRQQAGGPTNAQRIAGLLTVRATDVMFTVPTSPIYTDFQMPHVAPAVRPLLQLTQVLLSQGTSCKLDQEAPSENLQSDLCRQSKSRSPLQPCHLRQYAFQLEKQEHRIAVMQTAALICKLLSLLAAVKNQTSSSISAIRSLWEVLHATATLLLESRASSATSSICAFSRRIIGGRCLHSAWDKSEIRVSDVLVSSIMSELQGQLKQSAQRVKTCCILIESLLPIVVDNIWKFEHFPPEHIMAAANVSAGVRDSGQLPNLVCPEPMA